MSWEKIISIDELKKKERYVYEKGYIQVLIIYFHNQLYAFQNQCPHQNLPLDEGYLSDQGKFTCPWHSWTFDITKQGENIMGTGGGLTTILSKVENGDVWLDV